MTLTDRHLRSRRNNHLHWVAVVAVLFLSILLGYAASPTILLALLVILGGLLLLKWPVTTLLILVTVTLLGQIEIGTGTEVALNPSTLLVPATLVLWIVSMVRQQRFFMILSGMNRPLLLFLAAGLFSLLIGDVFWDPAVPRSSSFILVQLAQWAIFAFSVGALLLAVHLIKNERELRYLTFLFLFLGGGFAILRVLPLTERVIVPITTITFIRAPFWVLLTALAGSQMLFNPRLTRFQRVFLLAILGAVLFYSFEVQQEAASNWVGVTAVIGTLVWLRFPRIRGAIILLIAAAFITGFLFPAVYDFAGGDAEWFESGGARVALITRVIDMTMRNPITGLGPAAYRVYGFTQPLNYAHIVWLRPGISSHNNYVDIFSQTGIVGLALFFWFVVEATRLGIRLRRRFTEGFSAGYVNGMLAAGAGSLCIMMLADWILPFVYNIGFPGFQASVLVWLFLGGLVALDQITKESEVAIKQPMNTRFTS